jgi:hypothetical protein
LEGTAAVSEQDMLQRMATANSRYKWSSYRNNASGIKNARYYLEQGLLLHLIAFNRY